MDMTTPDIIMSSTLWLETERPFLEARTVDIAGKAVAVLVFFFSFYVELLYVGTSENTKLFKNLFYNLTNGFKMSMQASYRQESVRRGESFGYICRGKDHTIPYEWS